MAVVEPPSPKPAKQDAAGRSRGGRHRLDDTSWLGLLERVLCSWPITLRVALLLVILLTGTAAIATAVGIVGQLLLAALCYRARRFGRRS